MSHVNIYPNKEINFLKTFPTQFLIILNLPVPLTNKDRGIIFVLISWP